MLANGDVRHVSSRRGEKLERERKSERESRITFGFGCLIGLISLSLLPIFLSFSLSLLYIANPFDSRQLSLVKSPPSLPPYVSLSSLFLALPLSLSLSQFLQYPIEKSIFRFASDFRGCGFIMGDKVRNPCENFLF